MAEGVLGLVCQAISVYVVSVCMIVKVPQILNVVKSTDAKGLNMKSVLMEFWCFTTLFAYPCAQGYPLSGYLEFLLLTIQDLVLLVLVLKNNGLLNATSISILVGFLSFIVILAKGLVPSWILYAMMTSVTPLSASAKLLQMWTIVSNKSSGSVSGLSWSLATSTAAGRILTLLVETGDYLMVFISTQAAVLNLALCLCATYYSKPKVKDA